MVGRCLSLSRKRICVALIGQAMFEGMGGVWGKILMGQEKTCMTSLEAKGKI